MADRTVKVTLRAEVQQYLDGMEKAAQKTRETGTEAEKLAQKREAFDMLGKASLAMGAAAAAGLTLAVVRASEFDQAMSNVNAVMQETTENQKALRQAALDFGASSVFTAKESANAIEELGKAGISTSDILSGALAGSLNLASAGELGIARAAEVAATTLQQFGLAGDQASRVADVLAAGAGKAMGSVDDLANGLKFVGPIAASMNISLEETVAVLAMFAQQGIIGEQAGTSLRGMLSSLTSPSKEARKEMERLGITLYDSEGGFLGLENAAGELSKAYTGLTDEQRDASLGILFGNQQITAARVLYKGGAQDVRTWTKAVDDTGYAARVASDRLDNLAGDVEALGGAFDTALITTGSQANDVLRLMTQTLTNVVDLYNDAPEPVKAATLAVGGIAAAAGLAGGAFFLATPRIAAFNAALATMGPTAQRAGAMLSSAAGPLGLAFVAAGAAVAIFAGEQAKAKARTDAFSQTIDVQTGKITDSTRELVKANLSAKRESFFLFGWIERTSIFDVAEKLGLSLDVVTDAAMGNSDALAKLIAELEEYEEIAGGKAVRATEVGYSSLGEYEGAVDAVVGAVTRENQSIDEAQRTTKQKAAADEEAAKSAKAHEDALAALEGKAESTGESIDDLADKIKGFGSATLDVREANRNLEDSYDALTEAINNNGTTLDITTEAGRANESAIDDIVKSTLEAASATAIHTGSQEEAAKVLESGREQLRLLLNQFGITGEAADDYIDKLGLIPSNIDTTMNLIDTDAKSKIAGISDMIAAIPRTVTITATGKRVNFDDLLRPQANGSVLDFYANGGMRENHVAQIAPAGAWRVWAEPETGGEAYIPLAVSKRVRSLEIWRQTGARLGVRGFADGGVVSYASSRYGAGAGGMSVSPVVSLAGATLLMSVDGRQMTAVIQEQIVRTDDQSRTTLALGKKGI